MTNLTKDENAQPLAANEPPEVPLQISDNVFGVLAQRAAERSPAELWTTAIGGSVNAACVWWQHPALHWLGAGFTAVAAYGIWGLANRAIVMRDTKERGLKRDLLVGVRGMMVPIGVISAIAAVGSFMAAALGGWNH